MTDFETWIMDNRGRVFRYWVYKRMFTPEEQAAQYIDQSVYTETFFLDFAVLTCQRTLLHLAILTTTN